jgi:hypothetical protein
MLGMKKVNQDLKCCNLSNVEGTLRIKHQVNMNMW